MAKKRKKWTISRALAALLGLACALALCVLFYGTMVYQLAGEKPEPAAAHAAGGPLALGEGELTGEVTQEETVGGAPCRVVTRTYTLSGGQTAQAITAYGASYLEKLAAGGVAMQLITGFVIDDLDAVYALAGDTGILAARDQDVVYMIEAALDQQALYALGAGARR